jgi:hypothetical protein
VEESEVVVTRGSEGGSVTVSVGSEDAEVVVEPG